MSNRKTACEAEKGGSGGCRRAPPEHPFPLLDITDKKVSQTVFVALKFPRRKAVKCE